ncbi:uncharacterized protein LOC144025876 isoform X2 [Festucalex cinctus]
MWCYQKPGFEAHLVAELQRQQQHRQFCDTLLRAEGVTVPVHSCVLSAISPQLSTALSSSPAPQPGREHLVEFGTVGARTLLQVVNLLYSGEMAGQGESEKQQAVSATAKLGILGLVEVPWRDRRSDVGTEVGVQTDPVELREKEVTCCPQEVSEGNTILWKATLSNGEKDTLTEAEEMQASSALSCQSVPTYETIEMAQFESLVQPDNHVVQLNVPTPLICLLDEAQNLQTSPVAVDTPWVADSQSYVFSRPQAESSVVDGDTTEDKQFEQFLDDIPGFINHFLDMDSGETNTGRAKTKPRGTGRARQRGGACGGARRGRRGRGGLTQTVDVQEVRVSRQHKSLLRRCGRSASMRTGQGGGTIGRKLHLRTRHRSPQGRQRRPKLWDFCPSGQNHSWMGGGDNVKRDRRKTPHDTQVSHAAQPPAPPPPANSPGHFDHLFEEVMRELEVKLSNGTPPSQPPPTGQMCSCAVSSCGDDTGYPARSCAHGSTEVVATGEANGEMVVLGPQAELNLTAMLEDLLESLGQDSDNCVNRETQEEQDDSRFPRPQRTRQETTSSRSRSNRRRASTRKTRRKKRRPLQVKQSIRESVRDATASDKIYDSRGDRRLQWMPVVKLNRHDALHPVSFQALKMNPAQSKTNSSSVHQPVSVIRKTYPIRSRCKAAQITPIPEEVPPHLGQPDCKRGRRNRKLPREIEVDALEEIQVRCENNATQEEAARRAAKRIAQPEEDTRYIASEAKRKCFEPNIPEKSSGETTMQDNTEEDRLGTGSEEDIDVIGPLETIPDPVTITWSLSSGSEEGVEEDEELDVVGGAYLTSLPVAFTLSNSVDRTYHVEVPLS